MMIVRSNQHSHYYMLWITLEEFKAQIGDSDIKIRKSKSTGKTYAVAGGKNWKVEAAITTSLPIKYMYETEELFDKGTLVNIHPVEDLMTL